MENERNGDFYHFFEMKLVLKFIYKLLWNDLTE